MKIKIGVAHTGRVVEIEGRESKQVRSAIEKAFAEDHPIIWVEDGEGTQIGIPRHMLAFVEFEAPESGSGVGFAAGS